MSEPEEHKGRSQATGTKLGKGARRALSKNADCVKDYLQIVATATTVDQLTTLLEEEALTLARVTRATGGGRLEVNLQDGTEGVSVPISGTLKFKGRSSTKTDRANCMCAGDVIIIRGSFASAKLSPSNASAAKRKLEKLGVHIPMGFFASAGTVAEEDAFEFDRNVAEPDEEINIDEV
jgi:hypothetical protein